MYIFRAKILSLRPDCGKSFDFRETLACNRMRNSGLKQATIPHNVGGLETLVHLNEKFVNILVHQVDTIG